MPANLCAVIEDTETGERGQLGMDAFVVNLPANTLYEERFVLHFNAMPSLSLTSTVCDGLDVTELEGEWDAWSLTWSSDDGTASGEGMPYDLANGDYTFTYALPSVACANEVDVEVNAACLGDFNLNGERDIIDLLFLLAGLPGNNGAANIGLRNSGLRLRRCGHGIGHADLPDGVCLAVRLSEPIEVYSRINFWTLPFSQA